ncbi:hypothetical protein LSUE1_G006723 [Lachnellula suecica]|uniref:Uncharacterized protein n=1 Tax=Lachnellula suecica TaxID=602035 RepID=A0A8T9C097_9HELO|nr:hypothetical protein LSUE1_G006723 [Lachnellula suecica]
MKRVTKVFFDPLASTKQEIRAFLEDLPAGSAHPFSPERVLLLRTASGIEEIDISSYSDEFFFNAVDLGELGETLLKRMAGFPSQIGLFNEYAVQQAPSSTFQVPIIHGQIAIFAISKRDPTYYDFCLADADQNTCCFDAERTFDGITHSGDHTQGSDLLQYIKVDEKLQAEKEFAVFVSGYSYTKLTRFRQSNPVVLVANHTEKVLYIIPVPLDAATIGEATICCPVVVKRDGNSLTCSILSAATTDTGKMCSGKKLPSPCFREAIQRADFALSAPVREAPREAAADGTVIDAAPSAESTSKPNAVISTKTALIPCFINTETTQIIRFGSGIEFQAQNQEPEALDESKVVLPCIFGSKLEGPVLLATGLVPKNVPFSNEAALRAYYEQLKSIVVIVDDRMTDNARNLASTHRINALFIVQATPKEVLKTTEDILKFLDTVNVNAVTALAGPASLVLIQINENYYFYRGIANRTILNTPSLAFGADVTGIFKDLGGEIESIIDPRADRFINLEGPNTIILPTSGQVVQPLDLKKLFEGLPVDQIPTMEEDISAAVPQLQTLLSQIELQDLSKALIMTLSAKVNNATAPRRQSYINFLTKEYEATNPESAKRKADMLGELRTFTKQLQKTLESATANLANMMSSQTTSKRTHDLNRLLRQTTIQNNVEAAKNMTFDSLAGMLETQAEDMGVMLLNIETTPYTQLLRILKNKSADIDASACCNLDSRVLYLEGMDAGIIMEQSRSTHSGPLSHQLGPENPTMALPYLDLTKGNGSMLAWVCWDEFVNLKTPFGVRWMEKCNDSHIAALRIMMRGTLSNAVASREFNFQAGSPEIGQLMVALLMAAMSKLATKRTTAPSVTDTADDTVTKLMRGLFGNLLTVAGSGVRPMSMVWQLFGQYPKFDIPSTVTDWSIYTNVVALYPYTGWPIKQFHENLEKLLDKVLIRVVTKNENVDEIKASRSAQLINYCKLRNIQLEHSRTILKIFTKLLAKSDVERPQIAERLLKNLPHKLGKQSQSYTKMIDYLEHLRKGGERRANDDLVLASVFTKRSAAFSAMKNKVAKGCQLNDGEMIKAACQDMMQYHARIVKRFNVDAKKIKIQMLDVYTELLNGEYGNDIDEATKASNKKLFDKVEGDAERHRIAWQVGKKGEFGNDIEELDVAFVEEIMTGVIFTPDPDEAADTEAALIKKVEDLSLAQFSSVLKASFVSQMESKLSAEDACKIMGVPVSAMRVFAKALNPAYIWDEADLGSRFREVVFFLMKDRSNRDTSLSARRLLGLNGAILETVGQMQIEE